MRIETVCNNRKEMVKRIGEFVGQKPSYVGPPSFAYVVADFTIERDGTVVCESEIEGEKMREHLEQLGFVEPVSEPEDLEVSIPIEGMDGLGLQNLVFMLKSKQYLLNRVVGKKHFLVSDKLIKMLQSEVPESKGEFMDLIQEAGTEAIAGISFDNEKVTFTFPVSETPEKNRSYVELAAMMVAHAKEAKRVSPQAKEPENEKYYLRIWLLRIGMAGAAGKASRKALLEGLKGHTAFRTPADEEKHKARLRERKKAETAADNQQ